jgi:hypothetical protein
MLVCALCSVTLVGLSAAAGLQQSLFQFQKANSETAFKGEPLRSLLAQLHKPAMRVNQSDAVC